MPVAFGFSIGDFLATIKLVATVVDALRKSSAANTSFRSLIHELYALQSALLSIKNLDSDVSYERQASLRDVASKCQQTIDEFHTKIKKYQPHLQELGSQSRLDDAWAKIKWTLCKKNDVDEFRAEIRGHIASIMILLASIQTEAMTTHTKKHDSQYQTLSNTIQAFSFKVMSMLRTITDGLAQTASQGRELLMSSARIVETNLRIFQIVNDVHSQILRLPSQIQRQQPVYLIDPFNRECPFHLEFVRSAEALLAVLKLNLKSTGCGPAMIDRGEYVIEESATQIPIDLNEPWEACFFPGQKVAMSMKFREWRNLSPTCPRCGKYHPGSTGKEVTCGSCGAVYRRIQEIEDTRDVATQPDPSGHLREADTTQQPVSGPTRPPSSYLQDQGSPLANIRKFRRIQLMNRSIIRDPHWYKDNPFVREVEFFTSPGYVTRALAGMDTQSAFSILSSKIWNWLKEGAQLDPYDEGIVRIDDREFKVLGIGRNITWSFFNGAKTYETDFLVIEGSDYEMLIGQHELIKYRMLTTSFLEGGGGGAGGH